MYGALCLGVSCSVSLSRSARPYSVSARADLLLASFGFGKLETSRTSLMACASPPREPFGAAWLQISMTCLWMRISFTTHSPWKMSSSSWARFQSCPKSPSILSSVGSSCAEAFLALNGQWHGWSMFSSKYLSTKKSSFELSRSAEPYESATRKTWCRDFPSLFLRQLPNHLDSV